jgi:O-antigen/teichoic acid export membrane protein
MTAAPSLTTRVMRSSAITVAGFMTSQVLRLATNLILTRLLFPEAFGLMAIVAIVLMGLAMFSDVGTGPAIMGSPRGDDRAFLDTAFSLQLIRGVGLYLAALALTWPVAAWYGEPMLTQVLPVAALTLLIQALQPTKLQTAHRHLMAGRVTLLEVAMQVVSLVAGVLLAWWLGSVWALVASSLIAAAAHTAMMHAFLPGPADRPRWDRTAARELIGFGKWVFLATACGFAIGQADKVLIGGWLSLGDFGLYTIAFFLASFPFQMGAMVMGRVLIPATRQNPPGESATNFARYRRLRAGALAALFALSALLALGGPWIVGLLYDPRYQDAGGIVVMIASIQAPALIILTCDQVALARGDSRRFFLFTLIRAALIVAGIAVGLQMGGLTGALVGWGVGNALAYPALAWLLAAHGSWDWRLDTLVLAAGIAIFACAFWYNEPSVARLALMNPG